MKRYIVIYEPGAEGEESWITYVLGPPGCVTTGDTVEEAQWTSGFMQTTLGVETAVGRH
ncbi:MAG: type II toxin-antitoxin system HicB family antitoxin [Chloroflexi bacterium]|nr:type II toxin-antitoxin system HicB family antitoxin [Chloroflexota bacterium]